MRHLRTPRLGALLALCTLALPLAAQAQADAYPNKPITIVAAAPT